MKKRLLVLIALLLIPFVSAEIIINGVDKIMYNRGDQITISGYVLRTDNADGTLDFSLVCDSGAFPLTKRVVSNTKTPQDFTLPAMVIPSTAEGQCRIKTQFIGTGGIIIETVETNKFIVTKAMEGKFEISPIQLQLGKSLTVRGNIQGAGNDKNINGVAEIYLTSQTGEKFYMGTTNIADGRLEYLYVTTPILPGKYLIQINAKDMYGNEQLFADIGSFNFVNEIYVFAKPVKTEVEPTEKLRIVGETKTVLQEEVPEATVTIKLDDNEYIADIKESRFEYDLQIPPTIKSGKHKLTFSVKDTYGNWGETDANIYVKPLQTTIKLQTNRNTFLPGDKVEITASVYDQAGDLMTKMVNTELVAPNGDIAPLDTLGSGQKISFEILQFAVPGKWTIRAKTETLEAAQEIEISEVKSIDVSLENQTIVVWNNGNVEYNEPVNIDMGNGQYQIIKKTAIKPNEKIMVDLAKEAPSGQYDILVTGAAIAPPKKFQDVIIIGKQLRSANSVYYFLIAVIVGALAYLLIFKKKILVTKHMKEEREKAKAQKTLERLREIKAKEKPKFYADKESSIQDYKQQVLKQIKETEAQDKDRKRFSYRDNSEGNQPPKKGGLFNMFE